MSKLLSNEQVRHQFPRIPQKGIWYEIIDYSDDDALYSNGWFYGFLNGKHIYESGNLYNKIRQAGDGARTWKKLKIEELKAARG